MRHALVIGLLAVAAPLLAIGSESWPGLAPCALCLWQRWPYWVAGALAFCAPFWPARSRLLLGAAGVAVLASGAIAALHVGVEQGWWPSPLPGCEVQGGGGAASVEELMRNLAPAPAKPCDEATYLIPGLPLSMAAMNLLYALGLGALALRWATTRGRER